MRRKRRIIRDLGVPIRARVRAGEIFIEVSLLRVLISLRSTTVKRPKSNLVTGCFTDCVRLSVM